jgi:hypothetical protein
MKNRLLSIALLVLCSTAYSQGTITDSSGKYKSQIFKASIYGKNAVVDDVYLVSIADSSITVSSKPVPFNLKDGDYPKSIISYADIQSIQLARTGSAGLGALIGFLVGAGIGVIAGLSAGDDKEGWFQMSAGEKALGLGILMGGGGGLVGLIIGITSKKKYSIYGNAGMLKEMNRSMLEKLYVNPSGR